MKSISTSLLNDQPGRAEHAAWRDRAARRLLLDRLEGIRDGCLVLRDSGNEWHFGTASDDFPVGVTLDVHDARFYGDTVFGGSIGSGESYMQGAWTCSDLTALVRLLLRNRDVLDGLDDSPSRLRAPLQRLFHWLHRNTRRGARRNIHAHYDLGNEFFALFLDPTLSYSSTIYPHPGASLETAAEHKLEHVCRKLDLSPEDHLLEIGSGWGGLAIHAAQHHGCRVTTTTISARQYEVARQRVAAAGLQHRVTVLFKDYRELDGVYDKLVSIEMIEAIGHQYLPTYFRQCARLLKDDGLMLLQAITIADQRYRAALRDVDFIQRYIFPGGFLPSVAALTGAIAKHSDLRLYHLEDIGEHYATTLRDWRRRFLARLAEVRKLGYSEAFIRMWEFYLCYCEGGFTERATGTVQMLLSKPGNRRAPLLAAT